MTQKLLWCPIPNPVFNVHATLANGQCFRWENDAQGDWRGVIADQFVLLKPKFNGFEWQTFPDNGRWDLIEKYFALDIDIDRIYSSWQETDQFILESMRRHEGMRILRQSPNEALFSFLCASNNSILKIRRSVRRLAERAGTEIWRDSGVSYYEFPTASQILEVTEVDLRSDMWGYRAPTIRNVAFKFANDNEWCFFKLALMGYEELVLKLTELHGIGLKLADCIALFGFGHTASVPVDTHIRQIAESKLKVAPNTKSLTPSTYRQISNAYRERYGDFAGWAQQYLFYDSLNATTAANQTANIRNLSN